jgi:hypothetical protein
VAAESQSQSPVLMRGGNGPVLSAEIAERLESAEREETCSSTSSPLSMVPSVSRGGIRPAAAPAGSSFARVISASNLLASGVITASNLLASPLGSVIAVNNLLALVLNNTYLSSLNTQLRVGVPRNARDALDLAGKLPLALKANAIGIPANELNIDPAQAGGLLGKFDALVGRGGAEIKGARSCRGEQTFQFSRLRAGTPFEHLMLVARSQNPTDWTDLCQLDRLFWLGYVSRAAFDRALAERRQARLQAQRRAVQQDASDEEDGPTETLEVKAYVTIGSRRDSWLGPHIQWVRFKDLTLRWWNTVHGGEGGEGVR